MVLKQVYKDCAHIPALQLSWQGGVCQSIFKSGECKIIKLYLVFLSVFHHIIFIFLVHNFLTESKCVLLLSFINF